MKTTVGKNIISSWETYLQCKSLAEWATWSIQAWIRTWKGLWAPCKTVYSVSTSKFSEACLSCEEDVRRAVEIIVISSAVGILWKIQDQHRISYALEDRQAAAWLRGWQLLVQYPGGSWVPTSQWRRRTKKTSWAWAAQGNLLVCVKPSVHRSSQSEWMAQGVLGTNQVFANYVHRCLECWRARKHYKCLFSPLMIKSPF